MYNLLRMSSSSLQAVSPLKSMQSKEENNEQEKEESSSSCSLSEENMIVVSSKIEGEEQVKKANSPSHDDDDDDDDDGYHTPTSPRHRLPADFECPPAPRKPFLRRRPCKKRKACRHVEITEVEVVFFAELMDEGKTSKKARKEAASNE